ncbi:MAG: D-alanine--D-alanine ligase [Patescibacteria group bacterium]|jgi:D-alanine-D-alanine ligase
MSKSKPKILVLSGGVGGERDVSLESGRMVAHVLDREIFQVFEAELTKELEFIYKPGIKRFKFLDGLKKMQAMDIDCVFPALHGEFGEDGQLQTILEILKIPFVGSGPVASRKAMDKGIAQALFLRAGFRVPETRIIQSNEDLRAAEKFLKKKQLFVIKPLNGGSSVGVLITNNQKKIRQRIGQDLKNNQVVVLQEYLSGRELTCGVIEKSEKEIIPLVPTEICPKNSAFFDYKAKYAVGGSDEITPPNLPESWIRELQEAALRAHKLFGCRGMSRADFILHKNSLYILEINTLPGMTKASLLPQGAAALGIDFSALMTILVTRALQG